MNQAYEDSCAIKFRANVNQILEEFLIHRMDDPLISHTNDAVEKICAAAKVMIHTKETGNLQVLLHRIKQLREAYNTYWKAPSTMKAAKLPNCVNAERVIDNAIIHLEKIGYTPDAATYKPEQSKLL